MSDKRLCVFGEVLFDHLPDGARVLGGAPFNVAWHLQAFGQSPCFISRVGRDAEGAKVKTAMTAWGMRIDTLQTDDHLPTGQVSVSIEDQVSLRPRDRFWDIPVPKIDSAFDNLFVPRPSRSLALRDNLASSLPLRCQLPMTGRRARMPTLLPLWRKARRVSSAASRLPGTTSLRFALHGWQRTSHPMTSRNPLPMMQSSKRA
ncbi:hypothetical protein DJ031_04880 [bacterium endosymbiont of Escarpia laminata]|nr:MAG: hypothetical protein DJ031_04880 [bacterium endosymbiont of Escarpia laminata]